EYKRKQLEEQRQAERLQRQLQQERDYLVSLQQQQQQQQRQQEQRPPDKKPLYHYKEGLNPAEKPAWAKEVQQRSLSNSPVLPAKQQHPSVLEQQVPLVTKDASTSWQPSTRPNSQNLQASGRVKMDNLAPSMILPSIQISKSGPWSQATQNDVQSLDDEVRLLLQVNSQENEPGRKSVTSLKGSRSQGCSPARDTGFTKVEERSRLNRQSSPAMPHKVANRISDPNLPPRSESFSISGVQPARTPPMHRQIDPQQLPMLVSVKAPGPSLSASQSLHEQSAKGMSAFQEGIVSHRPEMPRQNSDPTSENPPLPPRIEKFDRSSWLRPEEDLPPKVTILINPDLRRTETVIENPIQRTSSGSSSSSSTPSSQPSSQGGSQPGSQAGSSERNRVQGNHKPEASPVLPHDGPNVKAEDNMTRPSRPAR
ncbi:unnamed protein product, partial [Ranitomeya imitator]